MTIIRWIIGKLILLLDQVFAPRGPQRSAQEQERWKAATANMALYQFEACPFCVKVRRALKREGYGLPLRDAKQEPFRSELLAGGGKLQVPCLRIEEQEGIRWLYESDDIIRFLQSQAKAAAQKS